MVHHHHHRAAQPHQHKLLDHHLPITCSDCLGAASAKRSNSKHTLLLRFIGIFSIISTALVFAQRFFPTYSFEENPQTPSMHPPCLSLSNHSLCCDRTAFRTDVCFMRGDIRTHSLSNSLLLHLPRNSTAADAQEELIRPYTRKWEANTMATIDELHLKTINNGSSSDQACDVVHDVPAVVFSTGGYTGNVYHEFNDGILPLYITAGHFNKQVVFVLLEYHDWWITKYGDILSQLSDHPPIDFANDRRTHCFPEAIVGLKIHDELTIDPAKIGNNRTIRDFRNLLDDSYKPRIRYIESEEGKQELAPAKRDRRLKMVIVARNGSRMIENEEEVVKVAEEVGFAVHVLRPERTTELAQIYRALNSSDVMVGVHGAAMTHLLFMRPGKVFVQVVPLGTEWAAESYYGAPAKRMGLKYMEYKIEAKESSLWREYGEEDAVVRDPASVNERGWEVTKKVYLDGQNVRVDCERFRKYLVRAYGTLVKKKKKKQSGRRLGVN